MTISRVIAMSTLVGAAAFAPAVLVANFDNLNEGQWFDSFTNGGISFSNVYNHQTSYTNFAIEDASQTSLGSNFSTPNVLGFGGYVPGGGLAFGAFGGLTFSSNAKASAAGLDLWTFPLTMGGNTLTLTGYYEGQVVNSISRTVPATSFDILYYRFQLPTDDYDTFKLTSDGPSVQGDSFIDIDNVSIQPSAVPEPISIGALALGLVVFRRKRRR